MSAPDDERKEDRMMRRLEARAARDVEPSESDEVARLERLGDVGRLNLSDDEKEWFTSLEALPTAPGGEWIVRREQIRELSDDNLLKAYDEALADYGLAFESDSEARMAARPSIERFLAMYRAEMAERWMEEMTGSRVADRYK